ncbi:hypothetical protein [Aeoliella mucimassa]|uniref:Uncharacterized protein n=1 Tax=Aeoliella mucimassa TaxID=2527972 RepID=A0A518AHD9_9BACT|nr:hypothetical protein [Aeoliella mucimassa]QDU54139.1 hypothetical protein Pan181_03190 [Aeoliella mucimassa]
MTTLRLVRKATPSVRLATARSQISAIFTLFALLAAGCSEDVPYVAPDEEQPAPAAPDTDTTDPSAATEPEVLENDPYGTPLSSGGGESAPPAESTVEDEISSDNLFGSGDEEEELSTPGLIAADELDETAAEVAEMGDDEFADLMFGTGSSITDDEATGDEAPLADIEAPSLPSIDLPPLEEPTVTPPTVEASVSSDLPPLEPADEPVEETVADAGEMLPFGFDDTSMDDTGVEEPLEQPTDLAPATEAVAETPTFESPSIELPPLEPSAGLEPAPDEPMGLEPAPEELPSTEVANNQDDWQPTAPQPVRPDSDNTHQLVWLYASRLSFVILAPDSDLAAVRKELAPVVKRLDIAMPSITKIESDEGPRLKQLLSVGREVGEGIGKQYGDDHAALVEVAFKSNLLLAVAKDRPQLKHAINASVSAAAVRAGLPDTLWQPWQSQVAESDDASEIADAVIDLQRQVGNYLQQATPVDAGEEAPVLR